MIDRREMGECSQHNCFLFVACSLYQRRKDEHLLCVVLAVLSPTRGKPLVGTTYLKLVGRSVVRCAVCGGGWHTIRRNRHTDVTAHPINRSRLHVTLGRSAF